MPTNRTPATHRLQTWSVLSVEPEPELHQGVTVRNVQMDSRGAGLVCVEMEPGSSIVGTTHEMHETIFVIEGTPEVDIADVRRPGCPGAIFNIAANVVHGYRAGNAPVKLLAIYGPDSSIKDIR